MSEKRVQHPYYPRDLVLPHYVPNNKDLVELLSVFFGIVGVVMVGIWFFLGSKRHLQGKTMTKFKLCWFAACFLIHFILEGYFSVYHKTIAGEQTFLAQLWKEYGKGDSRYMSSDSFTVCMETITGFMDGPFALLAFLAFVNNSPNRFLWQLILSMMQLYGDVLYFMTEIKDGFTHSEMYHPLYFWFYFVFMNSLWIVIPFACICESFFHLSAVQYTQDKALGKKKS